MRAIPRPNGVAGRQKSPPELLAFSPMSPDLDDDSPLSRHLGEADYSSGPVDIAPSEIKRGKLLGKGSFAQVFAGICRGLPVAVKVLNDGADTLAVQGLRKFREEIAVHQRLYHPNVVLLMGACVTGDHLMIVQELMHKDLEWALYEKDVKLSLARRVQFARQIALGMNWLHKLDPPVLHRDLKPSNCLLDREMVHLKIADFGLSSILRSNSNSREALKESFGGPRGTANYLAPEVLIGNQVSTAADVYAYSIVTWQVLTRERPYAELGSVSVDSFTDLIVDEEVRPPIAEHLRHDYPILTDLIERCWRCEADDRPDFSEICDALTDGLVEIAIPHDAEAQSFWLKFFSAAGPEGIKIERCVRAMLKWFRLPANPEMRPAALQQQLSQLEVLMVEREDNSNETGPAAHGRLRITSEWFGSLMNWFGPLDNDFFKRVGSICSKPWFHGHLSGPHAQRLLDGRADGYYLVRFSGTEPGYFTISKIAEGKTSHVRIAHQPCSGKFSVGTPTHPRSSYKSIAELLEKERAYLGLGQPCPGSRFCAGGAAERREAVNGYLEVEGQLEAGN